MAIFGFVHVEHPEGLRLMDLVSISCDVGRCREMCASISHGPNSRAVLESLAIAIPVVYARVFIGGVRDQVRIPLDTLYSVDEIFFHKQMLELRSKHIAHSVNRMESQKLRAWLNPTERGGKKLNTVNAEHVLLAALDSKSYITLTGMLEKLLHWIQQEIRNEEGRLKPLIEQKYGLDQLYKMNASPSTTGGPEGVSKGRKRA